MTKSNSVHCNRNFGTPGLVDDRKVDGCLGEGGGGVYEAIFYTCVSGGTSKIIMGLSG